MINTRKLKRNEKYSSRKNKIGKNNFRVSRKNNIIWLNKHFLNNPEVAGLFCMESLLETAQLLFHLFDTINANHVNSNNFLECFRIFLIPSFTYFSFWNFLLLSLSYSQEVFPHFFRYLWLVFIWFEQNRTVWE